MGKQLIISIGREFGSSGHEIAEIIAKDLNLPLYDRSLLENIAEEKGFSLDTLQQYDEKRKNVFISRSVRGYSNSIPDAIAQVQFDYIREKAASGESFVVVGRCAEVVLKDNPDLFYTRLLPPGYRNVYFFQSLLKVFLFLRAILESVSQEAAYLPLPVSNNSSVPAAPPD